MVDFENYAWNFLKKCQILIGFWPYQNKIKNIVIMSACSGFLSTFIFGLGLRFVKEWNLHLHIVIENFMVLVTLVAALIKLITIFISEKHRREIFERIATHFETIVDEGEAEILRDYSNKGLAFTIWCTITVEVAISIFILMPVMAMFYSYFFQHGVLEKRMPIYLDFCVDEQEYFYHILAVLISGIGPNLLAKFTFDLQFFLSVRHTCALFEIVNLRLKRASDILQQRDGKDTLLGSDEDEAYKLITSAVDVHIEALELTQSIDTLYRAAWFIILLLNAAVFAPLPVLMALYKNNPFEIVRRTTAFVMFPLNFYIIFLQGQMIIDYSSSIFDNCCKVCWYNGSKGRRCQNAILIIMSNSLKSCKLTGGNMFDLSMETYATLLKTAISYISMFEALDFNF